MNGREPEVWERNSTALGLDYSCAAICESVSRHALIFNRRHTQHKPSVEFGAHSVPQTVHLAMRGAFSASDSRFASSKISFGTTGSLPEVVLFFISSPPLHYNGIAIIDTRVRQSAGRR
jgi:hypothetical protein